MTVANVRPAFANSLFAPLTRSIESEHSLPHQRIATQKGFHLQAHLFGDLSPEWRFTKPFSVNIVLGEDGSYVISDEIFLVYGNGENLSMAMEDYISSFKEYYFIVRDGALTNNFDRVQLGQLENYIQFNPVRNNNAIQTERN